MQNVLALFLDLSGVKTLQLHSKKGFFWFYISIKVLTGVTLQLFSEVA